MLGLGLELCRRLRAVSRVEPVEVALDALFDLLLALLHLAGREDSWPRARIAHAVRAILLASATAATLAGRRACMSLCQGVGALALYITDRAPWISNVRT